jgi:hypothetical protein
MTDAPRSTIIEAKPIGHGLDAFRESARSVSQEIVISDSTAARDRVDREGTIARSDAMLC